MCSDMFVDFKKFDLTHDFQTGLHDLMKIVESGTTAIRVKYFYSSIEMPFFSELLFGSFSCIEDLQLDEKGIKTGSVDQHTISKMIGKNKCLKSLRLRQLNVSFLNYLSQGLTKNCHLKVLDISWSWLSQDLCECFKINTTIDTLKIRDCYWNSESFDSFCSCLSQNKGVKSLTITNYFYQRETPEMELFFSKLLKTNTTIIDLFLDDVCFVGTVFIEALFSNKTITSLHLRNCRLKREEHLLRLSEYVSSNKMLTFLDIRGNRIAYADRVEILFKVFVNHPSLRKVDINQTLKLYGDPLFFDNVRYIIQLIENDLYNNGRLWIDCELDFDNNNLDLFDRHNYKIKNMYENAKRICSFFLWSMKMKRLSLPKDVIFYICKLIWNSRFEVETWAKNYIKI